MFISEKFCPVCEKMTSHTDGKCTVCNNIEESKKEAHQTTPKFFED